MRLRRILGFTVVLAVLAATAGGLAALRAEETLAASRQAVASHFLVVLVFGVLGLVVAQQSRMRGSMVVRFEDWQTALRAVVNWGVLPGLILGLINYLFFFGYRYSPAVIPRIREMESFYDSFILSLESSVAEEVIFRLFILSCLFFSFRHLYARMNSVWPSASAILPVALSLVLSSLLFALVHHIYGFTAGFFGGMFLGWIYIRSGIESAIVAHFAANFLFFSAAYLI